MMIRNPWSISSFKGKWNPKDPNWTQSYINQVKKSFGVNPLNSEQDGIFFVDYT